MKIVLATTLSLCVAAVAATSAGHHVHSMDKDTVVSRALNERHDRNQERKKRNRGKHLNAGGGVDIERTPRGVEKPKRRGNPENLDAGSTPKQQLKGLEAEELELDEETKIAKHEARKKEKQRKRHKNETEVEDEGTFEDLEVEETHEDLATANVTETTATMSAEAPPKTQTFAASIQEKHGKPVKSDRKADKDKPGPGPAKKGEDQAEAAAASQQLENNSSSKKATILVSSMLGGALFMFFM